MSSKHASTLQQRLDRSILAAIWLMLIAPMVIGILGKLSA
jgi:hypothetical protein